jgi:hypothetical protein
MAEAEVAAEVETEAEVVDAVEGGTLYRQNF